MSRFISRFILIIMVLLAIATGAPALAAPETGTIQGSVYNQTTDSAVTNQEVLVKTTLNGNEITSKAVRTDSKGLFSIDGLTIGSGYTYQVTVNYQDADYQSEVIDFASGKVQAVSITVYDSTKSDAALVIENAHIIIYPDPAGLLIKTYAAVNNPDNLTYVGSKVIAEDKKETLKFFVPDGATESTYEMDLMSCCVYPSQGGFSDTMAVMPGSRQAAYTYKIPLKSTTYTLNQKFAYPVTQVDVLVQSAGITVNNERLVAGEPLNIEGTVYNHYSLENLAAGEVLNIVLGNLPRPAGNRTSRLLIWGGLGLVAISAVGIFIRRRTPVKATVQTRINVETEKHALLVEIAALDDRYAEGRLAEDAYQAERAVKMERLVRLMQASRGAGANR
ncbi:MAG: carboxypeptidase-like regulatory domain-containing protein [Dehalococcoidia bacterium]|nr:carboxypeptidase-like regulatory domain-containing protein [Dehalococcoidia bacterium]